MNDGLKSPLSRSVLTLEGRSHRQLSAIFLLCQCVSSCNDECFGRLAGLRGFLELLSLSNIFKLRWATCRSSLCMRCRIWQKVPLSWSTVTRCKLTMLFTTSRLCLWSSCVFASPVAPPIDLVHCLWAIPPSPSGLGILMSSFVWSPSSLILSNKYWYVYNLYNEVTMLERTYIKQFTIKHLSRKIV